MPILVLILTSRFMFLQAANPQKDPKVTNWPLLLVQALVVSVWSFSDLDFFSGGDANIIKRCSSTSMVSKSGKIIEIAASVNGIKISPSFSNFCLQGHNWMFSELKLVSIFGWSYGPLCI